MTATKKKIPATQFEALLYLYQEHHDLYQPQQFVYIHRLSYYIMIEHF